MSQITYFKDSKDVQGIKTDAATRIELENGLYRIFRFDHCFAETREPIYIDCKSKIAEYEGKTVILLYANE